MKFRSFLEHRGQWDTDAFRVWFGDSVVRDGAGNPLRVYTGTSKDVDFRSFRPGKAGLIWFTSDPALASQYAVENDSMGYKSGVGDDGRFAVTRTNVKSRVIPVYLRIENPFIDSDPPVFPDFKAQSGYILKKMFGHDGYISDGLYVIRNPLQIKSAIGNSGKFDLKKKDITK